MKEKDYVYDYYVQTFRELCFDIGYENQVLRSNMFKIVEINEKLKKLYKSFENFRNYQWEDFFFYFKEAEELYLDRMFYRDMIEASILELNENYKWLDSLWTKIIEYES